MICEHCGAPVDYLCRGGWMTAPHYHCSRCGRFTEGVETANRYEPMEGYPEKRDTEKAP